MRKRCISFILILCLGWAIHASAQFRIGAEAGYLNSNYSIIGFNKQPQHSFLVGAIVSYTIRDIGWLESGLTFQQKGFRFEPTYDEEWLSVNDARMKAYYLDLPLLMGFKFNITNELSILPKMGGFFSYGLHAKASFAGLSNEGEAFITKYDPFSTLFNRGTAVDPPSIRYDYYRIDAGFQAGLDVMWKQYALRGAYKHGLIPHQFFTDQLNCRTFSVSLAYYFFNK
jgi:hypothetical protein